MIAKKSLLAKLENALEIEEKGALSIIKVLKRKTAGSPLAEKDKSRLIEILETIESDSNEHVVVLSEMIARVEGSGKNEF